MRKTINWSITTGLLLLFSGVAYSVLADDGQLSRWEDSNVLDYPPPPVGGWEPLVLTYDPAEKESADAADNNDQDPDTGARTTAAPAPMQYAPPAGTTYPIPPVSPYYPAPAAPAPGYGQGWPPAAAPGYNRGYARPGNSRSGFPVPGFGGQGFSRGFNTPGIDGLPGNRGNPWNTGNPGGWAATPWGERGPSGWIYPGQNAAPVVPNGAQPAPVPVPNAQYPGTMSGGFNRPAVTPTGPAGTSGTLDNTGNAANTGNTALPPQSFDWNVRD